MRPSSLISKLFAAALVACIIIGGERLLQAKPQLTTLGRAAAPTLAQGRAKIVSVVGHTEIKQPRQAPAATRAAAALMRLPVTTPHAPAGYDRALFPHWRDADGNGCDTREDTLLRYGRSVIVSEHCEIVKGVWRDPYTGLVYTNPHALDIDHIIPLKAAWIRGASQWSTKRRQQFANDPLNTLAVESRLNRSKGDRTADRWQPPLRSFRCRYAVLTINVHSKYRLALLAAEKTALRRMLNSCP